MIEIFSYWIFIWFILYYLGLTKYNPLLILIVAYIFTLFELIYLIKNNISKYNFIKFFIINIIIKIIPILLIIKFPLKFNINDIYISIYFILIYFIIMIILNKNPYDYYKMMINTYINDNNNNQYKTFISKFYDFIYKIINRY
jgi:hypothetical protein